MNHKGFIHRFRFRRSPISVPSHWHPFYPSRSWTRAVWIRPWPKKKKKQFANSPIARWRLIVQLLVLCFTTSNTVISHPCFTDHIGAGQWKCFHILAFQSVVSSSSINKLSPLIIDRNKQQHHIDHFWFSSVWKKERVWIKRVIRKGSVLSRH